MVSKLQKPHKGFTLLEMLLTATLIGILATIVLVALNPNKQLEAARQARIKVDMNLISQAIQEYVTYNRGKYPEGIDSGAKPICQAGRAPTGCLDLSSVLVPTYIASMPEADISNYYIRKNTKDKNVELSHPKDEIWNIGGIPNLDLKFAKNKSLIDSVSGNNVINFTRNSTATYIGEDGLIKTAEVNEPRFDHNPVTGESLGLLVEESRINRIRNNTMQGAVVGAPGMSPTNWNLGESMGGINREIVGVGVEDGISYVDIRWYGTVTTNPILYFSFNPESQFGNFPGTNTVRYAFSSYIKVVGGTVPATSDIMMVYHNMNASFQNLQEYRTLKIPLSTTMGKKLIENRYSLINTNFLSTDTAYVRPYYQWNFYFNEVIDITLRIGMPQVELGSFSTSVIPTSGSTATRNADNASITGSNFSNWYNSNEGTILVQYRRYGGFKVDGFNRVFEISDGTNQNRFALLAFGTNSSMYELWGISNTNYMNFNTINTSFGNLYKYSASFKQDDFIRYGQDNTTVLDVNTDNTLPTSSFSANQLNIGYEASSGEGQLGGHISQLTYYPQRLPNTTLQRLTQ
jgi:prepilin-type N-terminal cleavage/methylation domain-containing protein